jgi:hypothetical protein
MNIYIEQCRIFNFETNDEENNFIHVDETETNYITVIR